MNEKATELTTHTSPNIRFSKLEIQDEHDDNKWYVEFNRLLHSRKCIYVYIFLIIFSVLLFGYSIAAYFLEMSK